MLTDKLDRDGLLCVVAHLPVEACGRLARTCAFFRHLLSEEESWADKLAPYGCLPSLRAGRAAARTSLRCLRTLEAASWSKYSPTAGSDDIDDLATLSLDAEAPPWRDHFVAVQYLAKIIIFGGEVVRDSEGGPELTSEAWVCDLAAGSWHQVHSPRAPSPRKYNADSGGGRVVDFGEDGAWLVIFGGLLHGMRDNETWLLGPLAAPLAEWQWVPVQDDGRPQSLRRPKPRFHHSMTVVRRKGTARDSLLVWGGHDWSVSPIGALGVLTCEAGVQAGGDGADEEAAGMEDVSGGDSSVEARTRWSADSGWRHQPASVHRDPRAKAYPAAAVWKCDDGGQHLVIAGGRTASDAFSYQTLLLDTTEMTWHRLNDHPWQRDGEEAVVTRDRLLLYGQTLRGGGGETATNPHGNSQPRPFLSILNLRRLPEDGAFRCGEWVQIPLQPPRPTGFRMAASLVSLVNEEVVLIFGGSRPVDEEDVDRFGDPKGGFLGLHETVAMRVPSAIAPTTHQQQQMYAVGQAVEALPWENRSISYRGETRWYSGMITACHDDDGTYDVCYDDGDEEARVPSEYVKTKATAAERRPVMTRCSAGLPLQSTAEAGGGLDPRRSDSYLLHELKGAAELNGAVGVLARPRFDEGRLPLQIIDEGDEGDDDQGEDAPRLVRALPSNLIPSQSATSSAIVTAGGTEAIAIHCSAVCSSRGAAFGRHMALSRLSMLPRSVPHQVEEAEPVT